MAERPRPTLYHFTCDDHGYAALGEGGILRPNWHPFVDCRVIWMTTEREPDREATGLSTAFIRCDRMKHRYVVTEPDKCRPWYGSVERFKASKEALNDLECLGDPIHWWIANEPVAAVLDD